MIILGQDIIEDSKRKHADARKALDRWVELTSLGQWSNYADLRNTFASADLVKVPGIDYTVFNIRGNQYRLIAEIKYAGMIVVVDYVLTHADYDKDVWKEG